MYSTPVGSFVNVAPKKPKFVTLACPADVDVVVMSCLTVGFIQINRFGFAKMPSRYC